VDLRIETVERVRAYWRGWEAQSTTTDTVSIVEIGHERFVIAPERWRGRLEDERPADLSALVAALGDDVARAVGEARLAYADATTFRPVPAAGVIGLEAGDARLAALEASSDRAEWLESSADEPSECRFGVVDGDWLLAVAALQLWDDALGHVSVFTAAAARRRGLAARVGGAVVEAALALGVVPQWRSRIGNDASAGVADKLGFVALGKQMTVRVNH
jgi:GNAT superfamily N-acetyltransferase